jgi:hypothetical protein
MVTAPLKPGTKVKLISFDYGDRPSNPIWGRRYGRIVGQVLAEDYGSVTVKWANGTTNGYYLHDLDYVRLGHPLTKIFKDEKDS